MSKLLFLALSNRKVLLSSKHVCQCCLSIVLGMSRNTMDMPIFVAVLSRDECRQASSQTV